MHKKSLRLTLILCCLLPLASAIDSHAAEPPIEQNGPMLGVFFSPQLALSEQQKDSVKEILRKNRDVTREDFFAFRDSQTALRDYLRNGGSEPGKIADLTAACGATLQKLQIGQAAAFTEAYQQLNETQKKTLASIKDPHLMPRFGTR